MKLRNIVLHVCMNMQHLQHYKYEFLKAQAREGAVILKQTEKMVIIGEEEHIFKTEREIEVHGINGLQFSRVEGFVPAHLELQLNSRFKR